MKEVYVQDGPFIKTKNNAVTLMNNILISLIPLIIFAFYKNGILPFSNNKTDLFGMFLPVILILISIITSILSEYLYSKLIVKKNENIKYFFKNKDAIISGIIFSLIISINTPIWLVILGSFLSTIIGKMLFGGFGRNKINAPLIGKLVVILISAFILNNYGYLNTGESSMIEPLNNFYAIKNIGSYEEMIKPYGSLWNFFFGTIPGELGTTSSLLCLLGFLYLVYKKAIKWRIPLTYIGTVFIMTYIIGVLNNVGLWYSLFNLLTGGLLFAAIYLASDNVTSPTTPVAQVIYGIFLGILTTILRYTSLGVEATLISILFLNLFVGLFDNLGARARFGLKKSAIVILVQIVIILGVSLYIAEVKSNGSENQISKADCQLLKNII